MRTFKSGAYTFQVSTPYKAGHVLTASEAEALNTHRVGVLRKAADRRIAAAKALGPVADAIPDIQSAIAHLDRTYTFTGFIKDIDPIELEMARMRTEGFECSDEELWSLAQKRVNARRAAAAQALDELMDLA